MGSPSASRRNQKIRVRIEQGDQPVQKKKPPEKVALLHLRIVISAAMLSESSTRRLD